MCVLVYLCVCYQFDKGVGLVLVGVGLLSASWDTLLERCHDFKPNRGRFQATPTLEIIPDLPCFLS